MDYKITEIQKVILETLRRDPKTWKAYSDFPIPQVLRTQMKREMKALKERGLVEYYYGVHYDDGKFGGSGFYINMDKLHEIDALIKKWFRLNIIS